MATRARNHLPRHNDPANLAEFGALADGFEAAVVVLPANNLPSPDSSGGATKKPRKGIQLDDKRTWGEKRRRFVEEQRTHRENRRFEEVGSTTVSTPEIFVASRRLSSRSDHPRKTDWGIGYSGEIAGRFVGGYRDHPRELQEFYVVRVLPLLGEGASGVGLSISDALAQLGGFERVAVPFSCVCRMAANQGEGSGLLRRDDLSNICFVEGKNNKRYLAVFMGRRLAPANFYQWHLTMLDIDTPSYRIGVNRHLILGSPLVS